MRVADNYRYQSYIRQISTLKSALDEASNQVSSGKRITAPSDGPVDYAKSVQVEAQLSRNSQYERNLNTLTTIGATYESSLNTMTDLMTRVKELAVQASSDNTDADGRKSAADEIDGIIQEMVALGNTKVGESYVFGGKLSNTAPYELDEDTNTVTFQGSEEVTKVYADSGTLVDGGISGTRIFNSDGVDIFATLKQFSTNLRNNDTAALGTDLDSINDCINLTANNLAYVGTYTKKIETMLETNSSTDTTLTETLSNLTDADAVQAYSNYTSLSTAYEAALTVLSKVQNLSLLDYLD